VCLARVLCACLLCALPPSPIAARLQRHSPAAANFVTRTCSSHNGTQLDRINVFYLEASGGNYVPRAVLFDLELGVIGAVALSRRSASYFARENLVNQNAGAGNNWVKAHYTKAGHESSAGSPCCVAAFVINSEPHTGARPSVRVCVGGPSFLAVFINPRLL
jgi:hypothetical protein